MKRSCLLLGIIVVFGCGGGGSSVINNSTPISGVLDVTNFDIPAGSSRTVTGDLTIRATGGITIAGTLRIPSGVNVNLLAAGDVNLTGQLVEDAATRPGGRGTGPFFTNVVGGNVRSTGTHSLGAGANLGFATRTANGTVQISGPITVPAGRTGRNSNENGQNGGAIFVGGPVLLAHLTTLGTQAFSPSIATIGASLTAGKGGNGWDDVPGVTESSGLQARPTHGGIGGDIVIFAGTLNLGSGVTLTAGAGGNGGWAGRTASTATYLQARDGTTRGEAGQKTSVVLGRGGDAGTISITANVTTGSATQTTAKGGQAGSAFVDAGNGGLIGNGGDVSVTVLAYSKNSLGAAEAPSGTIEVLNGYGGQGDSVSSGGVGGYLRLVQAGVERFEVKTIVLNDSLRGGNGYDGCKATPQVVGTPGGAGGRVENTTVVATRIARSLNGGDGGSSALAIQPGGQAGTPNGLAGLPGRGCGESALTLVLAHDTTLKTGLVLVAGTSVSMSRVRGGTVGNPEAGCDSRHVHGDITIDGYGPIEDMDHDGCGHGKVN